jgi:predicted ester cyclase
VSTEQNKTVVRRFVEGIMTAMDNALVGEVFAHGYVNHMMPGRREGFKQFLPMLRSAYPALKLHNSGEHLIAEMNHIVARITYHYSNAGKEVAGGDLSEYRVANRKIVEDCPPTARQICSNWSG